MKQILVMMAGVVLVGCGKKESTQPSSSNTNTTKSKATAGAKLWEFESGNFVISSLAISSNGTVYVGSRDNKLYAIKTDSKGPAKSPWPMFRQNAQHKGRAPTK